MTAVAGGLLIMSGTGPITFGDDGNTPLGIAGSNPGHDTVGIAPANATRAQRSGEAVAEVMHDGRASLWMKRLAVSGGNKAFVSCGFLDRLMRIIRVGIIVDDGVPF